MGRDAARVRGAGRAAGVLALLAAASSCAERAGDIPLASRHTGRPHRIQVVCAIYEPGSRPQSIGEPLRAFREIADAYEDLHPDVRIDFVRVPAETRVEGEYIRTQLAGGTAPEIVAINVEAIWDDVGKGWWEPLDAFLAEPNPYGPDRRPWIETFADRAIVEGKRAPDGKLYCIPIDTVETAIYYNRDIFRRVGVGVPETWAAFIEIQERLRAAGIIPFAIRMVWVQDWAQDVVFDQLFHEVLDLIDLEKASPEAERYLQGYLHAREICFLAEKGVFSPRCARYREVWRILHRWRRFWPRELVNSDPVRLFVTGRAAMIWEGSWLLRRLRHDPLVDFDWGIFYPPRITRATSPFADPAGPEAAVIGGVSAQFAITKRARDDGELGIAVDFLRFLTTAENTEKLVGEAGMYMPNIEGAAMPETMAPFAEILKRRYTTTKWIYTLDAEFNDVHKRMIALYLVGGIDEEGFLQAVDRYVRAAARRLRARHWDDGRDGWRSAFARFERLWRERGPRFWAVSGPGGGPAEASR